MRFRVKLFICISVALVLHACASGGHRQFVTDAQRPGPYQWFFEQLDEAVEKYKVREASVFRVDGFPYLRTNRFLEATGRRLTTEAQYRTWVEQMRELDFASRENEIRNLPEDAVIELSQKFGDTFDREALIAMTALNSRGLLLHDTRHAGYYDAVKAAIDIPDEYSAVLRTVGLYPLTSIPVTLATKNAYKNIADWYETALDELDVFGTVTVYAPPAMDRTESVDVAALFRPANRNALGMPRLTESDIAGLVLAYAPVLHQDVAADYDRPGSVEWQQDRVTINTGMPTVYYYLSYAFLKGAPILQINYAFWFTERAGPNAPAIEKGPLDGMTIRVNLDLQGASMMVEVMNNCGCYYFFVPRREAIKEVIPNPRGVDPLVPAWLPDEFPDQPLNFRINSGWHQVQSVFSGDIPTGSVVYQLKPYDVLESLPHGNVRFESVFNQKGIMKDSKRIEPVVFFPMGVPDIGYMRQRGHHPIKLIGRAHFTDPYLFEENFVFE